MHINNTEMRKEIQMHQRSTNLTHLPILENPQKYSHVL